MNILLTLIETALVLALYYIAYVLFLRNEKNFILNRFYLLFALCFALIYPFIRIKLMISTAPILPMNFATLMLPEIIVSPYNTASSASFSFFDILRNIYFAGIGIFAILFFVKIFNVFKLIIFSKKEKQNGVFLIKTKKNYAPFSFFNFVVMPENQYNRSEEATIILHEKKHIAQLHSLDLIFYEIIKILQWFNPFIWLYNRELRSVHEYIADEAVIENGTEKNDYFSLLLFNQIGCQTSKIGNNFNIILIKKRIKMLMKENSKKGKMLRLMPAMLVTAALLMSQVSFGQKPAKTVKSAPQNVENQQIVAVKNDTLPSSAVYVLDGKIVDVETVQNLKTDKIESCTVLKENSPEHIAKYGENAKNGVIIITTKKDDVKNVVYVVDGEIANSEKAQKLEKDGSIKTVNIYEGAGVRQEHIEKYGEKAKNGIIFIETKKESDLKSEIAVEEPQKLPEFIGEEGNLMEYLGYNLQYPKEAVAAVVNIRVIYSFVVEKDGTVGNIEWVTSHIEKDGNNPKVIAAEKLCKAEAVRVIASTSGKWQPAIDKNGAAVSYRMTLPVWFKLH
ncbi:MAG: hypothetical protein LBN95_08545 [Prevotellaceae bacterium]|jgi:hypothetical protein|nr:hypothetical protein [Prevotellaceae bacterium]